MLSFFYFSFSSFLILLSPECDRADAEVVEVDADARRAERALAVAQRDVRQLRRERLERRPRERAVAQLHAAKAGGRKCKGKYK